MMKIVLERLRTLERLRHIRFAASVFLLLLAAIVSSLPLFIRDKSLLLSGFEPYFYLNNGSFGFILSFFSSRIFFAKLLPFIISLILVTLLFQTLFKILGLRFAFFSSLIFIFSPGFLYLSTLTDYSLISLLFLLSLFFLFSKFDILALLFIYLLAFFGPLPLFLAITCLLIFSFKTKKFRIFFFSLPSLFLLVFFHPTGFNNLAGIISDFGARHGLGLFIVILSLFGVRFLWQRKYKFVSVYFLLLVFVMFSFFDLRILSLLSILLSILSAYGLFYLSIREWEAPLIQKSTVILMIFGIFFSFFSHLFFLSNDLPNQDVVDAISFLEKIPKSNILSHSSREPWLSYSGHNFVTNPDLFYIHSFENASTILNQSSVKYVWLDNDMKSMLWTEDEEGFLFLLENSKAFKKIFVNDFVVIWSFENV